jgi:hypothetical protein
VFELLASIRLSDLVMYIRKFAKTGSLKREVRNRSKRFTIKAP